MGAHKKVRDLGLYHPNRRPELPISRLVAASPLAKCWKAAGAVNCCGPAVLCHGPRCVGSFHLRGHSITMPTDNACPQRSFLVTDALGDGVVHSVADGHDGDRRRETYNGDRALRLRR